MKRIFMLSTHPLFCEGVSALLYQKDGMEFVGRESDVDRAIERIKELRPEVVIVDTGNLTCDASSVMWRIFQEKLISKVIGLNLNDNQICVYHEEQRPVQSVEDLMNAIETDSQPQTN